jgi:17 kDa outer membrane surface antigen
MRAHPSLVTLAAIVITAFVLIAEILLGSRAAFAEGPKWETRVVPEASPHVTIRPLAPPNELDAKDEIAALERVQYALSEVGDGTTYVWRRWHGRLAGVIHPISSFKDPSGKVCRHMMVLLTTGKRTSKMEGVACRLPSGRWQLDG